jgi:flagellar assembly protein FliH
MSKLHRLGQMTVDAAPWEPVSKTGARPARSAPEGSGAGQQLCAQNAEDRVSDMQEQNRAAHHRGFAEGEAAARQQAAAQLQAAAERMARTVEEIVSIRPRLRHEAEDDVVKLAMAVARRILYRELATDPEALLGLVRSALDKLEGREIHRIRANPQDAAVLLQHFQQMNIPRRIEVLADAALERGSAHFETEHGLFDASIETQLKEIERGFSDVVKRST